MKKIGWGRSPDGHEKPVVPDIPTPTLINSNTDALLLGERVDLTSWSDPQNIAGTIISDIILVFNKTSSISQKELVVKGILMPLVWNSAPPEEDPNYQYLSTRHIQKMGDYLYTASHGSQDRAIYRFGWINLYYMPIWFSTPIDPENPPWIVSNNAGVFKSESSLYKVLSWVNIEDLLGEQSWDWKDYLNIAVQRYDLEGKISFGANEGIRFLDGYPYDMIYFAVGNRLYVIDLATLVADGDPTLIGKAGEFADIDLSQIEEVGGETNYPLSQYDYPITEASILASGMLSSKVVLTAWGEGYVLGNEKRAGDDYYLMYTQVVTPSTYETPLADISFGVEGENKPKMGSVVLQYDKLHYNVQFPQNGVVQKSHFVNESYKRQAAHYLKDVPFVYCEEKLQQLDDYYAACIAKSWSAGSGTWFEYPWECSPQEFLRAGGRCHRGYGIYWSFDKIYYKQFKPSFKMPTSVLVPTLIYPIKERLIFPGFNVSSPFRNYSSRWGSSMPFDLSYSDTLNYCGFELPYSFSWVKDEYLGTNVEKYKYLWKFRKWTDFVETQEYVTEKDWTKKDIDTGCWASVGGDEVYKSWVGVGDGGGHGLRISQKLLEVVRQDWNEIKYISDIQQDIDLSAWGSRFIDVSN